MRRSFELDVEAFKLAVLNLARARAADSEVMVAALADVLGVTAAMLDKRLGPMPLDDRLDPFIERVRAQYRRTALSMAMQGETAGP